MQATGSVIYFPKQSKPSKRPVPTVCTPTI
jgi:hypothetical protein